MSPVNSLTIDECPMSGAYISDHPLSRVWSDLVNTFTILTGHLDESVAGHNVSVAGLVNYVRPHITRKGSPMAFAQIEDLQGTLDLVIFSRLWEQTKDLWEPERVLVVRGRINFRGREPSLVVESATNEILTAQPRIETSPTPGSALGPVHIHISIPRSRDLAQVTQRLGQIYDLLQSYPGEDHFSLYVENGGRGRVQIDFPNDTTGYCSELEQRLNAMVGAGTVQIESTSGL